MCRFSNCHPGPRERYFGTHSADPNLMMKLVFEAILALAGVGKNKQKWSYVYSPDAEFLGLLEFQLPSFWKPSLSQLFAAGPAASATRPVEKMTPKEKAARAQELKAKGYSHSQIMRELGLDSFSGYC